MDKNTFAKLVVEATQSLYRVSKSILRNDLDCEDAVSEAVTIAFQNLEKLKNDKYAKTWLTRILIHECFKVRKKAKLITIVSEDSETVLDSEQYVQSEYCHHSTDYYDLYQAMSCLNENQRLVITLHYYEGYSIKEIAKMTGVSQGTVNSRLGRARNNLREYLKGEGLYAQG